MLMGDTVQKERLAAHLDENQRAPRIARLNLAGEELCGLRINDRRGLVDGDRRRFIDLTAHFLILCVMNSCIHAGACWPRISWGVAGS